MPMISMVSKLQVKDPYQALPTSD